MTELTSNTSEIGDYKIIKTYEARLNDQEDPYDTEALLAKRAEMRSKINELQTQLAELEQTMIDERDK